MKIIFAGTPDIAKLTLDAMINQGFTISLVLTQPDRPSGRGNKITPSPVKELAQAHDIEVFQPQSFKNNPDTINKIKELNPDIIVVIAYGLILPQELLDIPKLGCINIHVSLLPRWRGAAPIQRSIIAGDNVTGVTIMKMDSGLDTGDLLLQQEIAIAKDETAGTLHDKLGALGSHMIVEYLKNYEQIMPIPQPKDGVTYANKIDKSEALINWAESAVIIKQKIAGFNPSPGCFSYLNKQLIKFWRATISKETNNSNPGTIISIAHGKIVVACGNNSTLQIEELQLAGKNRQSASEFLNSHPNLVNQGFDRSN